MSIKKGSTVVMNDKYYVSEKLKGKVWVVRSEPRELCGAMCVLLEDYIGEYALDGLTEIKGE
ncbi:MAG: hypothetical protein RR547_12210 [Raoultibacter sp.]